MGVDITTYRSRVGTFVPRSGAGMMPVFIDFSKLVKMIGVVIFIKMLLFRAGIEQNPGPTTAPTINSKVDDQTKSLREPWELNVSIGGDGPFTVKVIKDGTELTGNDHIEISHTADCVTVKVNKLIMEDSGSYRIDVSNDIGTGTCSFDMKVIGDYNFRYQYLLVEIGTKVLRKLFDSKVANNFGQYVATNPTVSNMLTSLMTGRNRKITVAQEQLLPPIKTKPVSSDFDITLLTCLLRNACGLRPQNDLVWMNPMPTDTSVEATITRLKDCRNKLSHSGTVLFPESDLNDKWTELSDILSELNKHCGKDGFTDLPTLIDAARHMDTDEKMQNHFTETIKMWYENDQEVKAEVMKLREKVTEIATNVSGIKRHYEDGEQTIYKRVKGNERKPNIDDASDIRENLIRIYQEDCSTLSVSPLFEDETAELLKIYQNPTMFRVSYNTEQRKENSKHENQEEQTIEDKNNITSYQGIFVKEDRLCKNIYITGDAGVGKTSLCKRMCLLWCKSKSNDQIEGKCDDKTGGRLKADVQYMSRFDFVFYVTLRDTDLIDINAMIVEQLFYTDNHKENDEMYKRIKNILMNNDCLVILDGFDEWTPKTVEKGKCDKPSCKASEKCVFLTTCRPYKISNIRLLPTQIDQQVQITGIDTSHDYVEYLLKDMNETNHDFKDPDEFINDVSECKLTELLCIPMIASHLVVLWCDRKLTEMSQAHIYSHILDMLFERAEKRKVNIPKSPGEEFQLPDSLAEFMYLQQHTSVLCKLCLLSFKSLFNKDKMAANLVFSKQQLTSEPYKLSNEESDFLCQIGILSKNKVIGRYLKQKQKISFIHKSYIEFLAAFFVSVYDKCNSFDEIVNEWTCVDDVVQYKNFFLFLTGFSSQKMTTLLEKVYQSLSDHLHLCRKNSIFHYNHDDYLTQIRSLQDMIVTCFGEVRKYNEQDCRLLIEDFFFQYNFKDGIDDYDDGNYVDDTDSESDNTDENQDIDDNSVNDSTNTDENNDNDDDDGMSVLKQLLLLNTACVKSIHSDNGKYYPEFDQFHCLQCLIIKIVWSPDITKFTECMLQNKSTLHTVCIGHDYFKDKVLIPELPVRSLHHLTSLSLTNVEIHPISMRNLMSFLSDKVLIENIKLSQISWCDDWCFLLYHNCTLPLDLSKHTKLTSLCLEKVNIQCNNVNNSSLQSIKLSLLQMKIIELCYIDVFNCIIGSQLEHLHISGYSGDGFEDVHMLEINTLKTLISTVKTLSCIKKLKLAFMKLPDEFLIQLHPHVTQVEIELSGVMMSHQCFHGFIENCVNIKAEVKVRLIYCTITSVFGETDYKQLLYESWKYMSEYLKSKSTKNIIYKGGLCSALLEYETKSCQ